MNELRATRVAQCRGRSQQAFPYEIWLGPFLLGVGFYFLNHPTVRGVHRPNRRSKFLLGAGAVGGGLVRSPSIRLGALRDFAGPRFRLLKPEHNLPNLM